METKSNLPAPVPLYTFSSYGAEISLPYCPYLKSYLHSIHTLSQHMVQEATTTYKMPAHSIKLPYKLQDADIWCNMLPYDTRSCHKVHDAAI